MLIEPINGFTTHLRPVLGRAEAVANVGNDDQLVSDVGRSVCRVDPTAVVGRDQLVVAPHDDQCGRIICGHMGNG